MPEQFTRLFSPIKVGSMTVPNRIAETTHLITIGRLDGLPDDGFIAYHAQKAKSGVGWIGNQTWMVGMPKRLGSSGRGAAFGRATMQGLWDRPDFMERMKRFFDAIHQYSSVAVMQLTFITSDFGPSAEPRARSSDDIAHEMEVEEIQEMVQIFAKAALRMREAGADGVELHGSHECMPEIFFSPIHNKRTDAYGGSLENRTRFAREILAAMKASAGKDFTVGLSFTADQFREDGYNLEDAKQIANIIIRDGNLDFLDVDAGTNWGYPSYIPPMYYPLATYLHLAAAIRESVSIPVLYRCRINDPIHAEKVLEDGHADIVGMCRAGIADPEFPRKAREGRLDEIRKCIGCNYCIYLVTGGAAGANVPAGIQWSRCTVNPRAGREAEWSQEYVPAQPKKRVVVVGGGPAGMECARVARERGHDVIVLEKDAEVGGQLNIASKAPAREGFLDLIRYQTFQARRLGIDVRLGVTATAESILALNPDTVVLATGSSPIGARFPGADLPNVVNAWDVLQEKVQVGQKVVVTCKDTHYEGVSVADFLGSRGKDVEFLHEWVSIAGGIENYTKGTVLYRLFASGSKPSICTDIKSFDGKTVVAYNVFTGEERRIEGVDTVVTAYGSRGDNSLYRALKDKVKDLYIIGAAYRPRLLADATRDGAETGRAI